VLQELLPQLLELLPHRLLMLHDALKGERLLQLDRERV
jgi:hypothetical protein